MEGGRKVTVHVTMSERNNGRIRSNRLVHDLVEEEKPEGKNGGQKDWRKLRRASAKRERPRAMG
jgi:hypothetical protein